MKIDAPVPSLTRKWNKRLSRALTVTSLSICAFAFGATYYHANFERHYGAAPFEKGTLSTYLATGRYKADRASDRGLFDHRRHHVAQVEAR
jgi:hypothetical protein